VKGILGSTIFMRFGKKNREVEEEAPRNYMFRKLGPIQMLLSKTHALFKTIPKVMRCFRIIIIGFFLPAPF